MEAEGYGGDPEGMSRALVHGNNTSLALLALNVFCQVRRADLREARLLRSRRLWFVRPSTLAVSWGLLAEVRDGLNFGRPHFVLIV